jgi:hypothetical protein
MKGGEEFLPKCVHFDGSSQLLVISIQPYALNGKGYWGDVPKMTELPKCPAHKGLKAPSPKVRKSHFDVAKSTPWTRTAT